MFILSRSVDNAHIIQEILYAVVNRRIIIQETVLFSVAVEVGRLGYIKIHRERVDFI